MNSLLVEFAFMFVMYIILHCTKYNSISFTKSNSLTKCIICSYFYLYLYFSILMAASYKIQLYIYNIYT